jgi:hypothetical protein
MGPNVVIPTCHKIHLTLEIDSSMQYLHVTKYNLHWKRGPIHAIPTYHKIHFTLEKGTCPCNTYISNVTYTGKGTHLCNTYISNITYTRKGSPLMQYLHIKCNLHWKRGPIHVIPTCQMKPKPKKGTHAYNTCKSNKIKPTL